MLNENRREYVVQQDSLKVQDNEISFKILHDDKCFYSCRIYLFRHGIFRILFDNETETKYKSKINIGEKLEKKNFQNFSLDDHRLVVEDFDDDNKFDQSIVEFSMKCPMTKHNYKIEVDFNPFIIKYYMDDKLVSEINRDCKLSVLNSKYFNPNSIDISVFNVKDVFGLPERLTKLYLTDGSYRLYNLDVFDQEPYNPQSLYGSIPMLHHMGKDFVFTYFINNPSESWVEIETEINNSGKNSVFMTEGGVLDIYLYSDSNINNTFYKTSKITGFDPLPPLFSLGYHHCRWGFLSQNDISEVDELMTQHEIPYDVFWLDIDVNIF